jgi:BarA-like signal transduction histidine kinase
VIASQTAVTAEIVVTQQEHHDSTSRPMTCKRLLSTCAAAENESEQSAASVGGRYRC